MKRELFSQIASIVGEDENTLRGMTDEEFSKRLFKVLAPVDHHEAYNRLHRIEMKSDNLYMSTLLQYNTDWNWEIACFGILN